MSFQTEKTVKKTRKEHNCDGCYAKIPISSEAKRGSGTYYDEFYSYIICIPCDSFLKSHRDYFDEGWNHGDIGEARREEGIA